ncbi:MAG: cupin domain-containing protein [Nitrospirota bacterium]|jgi:uncharacterized cupin superfamily protein
MEDITIERNASSERLEELGVPDWAIWSREESSFPWTYGDTETCFFLEGDVTVTPEGGSPVRLAKGDLVTFPQGMSCTWEIHRTVRKHYKFGG